MTACSMCKLLKVDPPREVLPGRSACERCTRIATRARGGMATPTATTPVATATPPATTPAPRYAARRAVESAWRELARLVDARGPVADITYALDVLRACVAAESLP